MFCSMTWVTLSSMVLADAPGYLVVIVTSGGAISGYWAIGSLIAASPPASMITRAITHAKIGRSIKNLTMAYSVFATAVGALAGDWMALDATPAAALTETPGLIFCRPATITCSPSLSPSVTST